MIFERTKAGEVMALARLLNVTEVRLMVRASEYQPCINGLDDMTDNTYEMLINDLTRYARLKEEGEVESFDHMLALEDGYDEDDDFDLERQMDKWEVQYANECKREEAARAMKYRDYCERKYGYDYS